MLLPQVIASEATQEVAFICNCVMGIWSCEKI